MKQPKHFLIRLFLAAFAVAQITGVLGGLPGTLSGTAHAVPGCPAGSNLMSPGGGGPDNQCYRSQDGTIGCQTPWHEVTTDGLNGQQFWCIVAPDGAPTTQGGATGTADPPAPPGNQDGCDTAKPGTVFKNGDCISPAKAEDCPQGYTYAAGTNVPGDPTTNNKCNKDDQDSCPIQSGNAAGNTALRWLLCPVIEMMNFAILGCDFVVPQQGRTGTAQADGSAECTGGLNGVIRSFLYTNTDNIFNEGGKTGGAYHQSWAVFRNLGVGLIMLAGLIMIVSEAFGVGFVDAYTIRKLLPRLLAAAVGITLSWSLCGFLVDVFNHLGSWSDDLIKFPFAAVNAGVTGTGVSGWDVATAFAQWGVILGGAAVGIGITIFAPGILFSLVGSMLLALLLAVAVLVIRQMVIVLCVLVSPLAIACAVLPNTQKLFSLWLSTFVRTLVMYPVIMAFLAIGVVFSWLASQQQSFWSGILGLIALILPYFFMPYAFKLSGGVMATVGGMVQEKSSGFLQARKEKRRERLGSLGHHFLEGGLHSTNRLQAKLQKPLNNLGEALGAGPSAWKLKWGGNLAPKLRTLPDGTVQEYAKHRKAPRWRPHLDRANLRVAVDMQRGKRAAIYGAKDEMFGAYKNSDPHMRVMASGETEGEAYENARHDAYNEKVRKYIADTDGVEKESDISSARLAQMRQDADHETHDIARQIENGPGFGRDKMIAAAQAWRQTGTGPAMGDDGDGLVDVALINARAARGRITLAKNHSAASSGDLVKANRTDAGTGAANAQKNVVKVIEGALRDPASAEKFHEEMAEQQIIEQPRRSTHQMMASDKPDALIPFAKRIKKALPGATAGDGTNDSRVAEERFKDQLGMLQSRRNTPSGNGGQDAHIKNQQKEVDDIIKQERERLKGDEAKLTTFNAMVEEGLARAQTHDNRTDIGFPGRAQQRRERQGGERDSSDENT